MAEPMVVGANVAMNYVVTAHKPTAVIKSVVGSFTGPKDLNLIVAKSTRLEVYTSVPTGLEAVLDVPLYGRVACLEIFRPKARSTDLLFLLTERYQVAILEYNAVTHSLDTVAAGDVRDTVGRPCDNGMLAVLDPDCRLIGLQLYDGMLKVIPLLGALFSAAGGTATGGAVGSIGTAGPSTSGAAAGLGGAAGGALSSAKDITAFTCRLEELQVIDIALLAGCDKPKAVVLYQDTVNARHLRAYDVSLREQDLVPCPKGDYWVENLDPGASMLAALPSGGVLVMGQQSIEYVGGPTGMVRHTVPMRPCLLKSWGRIDADGSRLLLSDHLGLMYVLVVARAAGQVAGLKLEIVGRTSSASSLSYLDAGVVFVGSRQGDSQLVRLHATPPDPAVPNSFVQVLETWPNLGPIVDFTVLDMDRQGQGQLVCCSGALSDGSLRVVRNGVGINEQASIELPGIRGLWSLRPSWSSPHHQYLVLGFVGETRLLGMNQEDELDEAELPGWDMGAVSLWCGNSAADTLVQVTPAGVRSVACGTGQLLAEWRAPGGAGLSVASGNPTQVVVATGDGTVHVLEVSASSITHVASHSVGEQVACVDITPCTGADPLRSPLVAVGTWGMSVHLYALPAAPQGGEQGPGQLQLLSSQPLEGGVIPRSVMLWRFEGVPHLLVGQGDGHLHYWRLADVAAGTLADKKKLVLGTKPVLLRPFRGVLGDHAPSPTNTAEEGGGRDSSGGAGSGGATAEGVFAATDRPAVLYSSNHKVLYANLNDSDINYMAPFNCPSFPDSLAIAKEDVLTIGTVDKIQKLHIRTLPLHEQPRRIAHQEATGTLGVLSVTNLGMAEETSWIRVYDTAGGMDARAHLDLQPGEMGCAIASCQLGEGNTDPTPYYVVGTAITTPEESEPSRGRVLVLQYNNGQLHVTYSLDVKGAVYAVRQFHGGRVLASCNNRITLYKWAQQEDGKRELVPACAATGHIMSLYLDARGDHVLVGDLMRSLSLYLYKPEDNRLELRAQDYASNWCTAVAMLDDDTYLAAENSYNLMVARKNGDTGNEDERGRLEVVGEYHLGEFVNRVRPGSLVVRLPDTELAQVPTWLYGTIDGSVGVLASLPPPLFELLERLQDALRKVVRGVGGLDHVTWRSFCNERKTGDKAKGFIDGDLVELFLDLKPHDAQKVVSLMGGGYSVEDVTAKVEELARLH